MSDAPKYLDVETWWEDAARCIVCAEDINEGDQMVWEPWPTEPGERPMDSPAHPACSVRNGYRLRYPDEAAS